MSLWEGLEGKLSFEEPLAPFTSFRIGGPAEMFFEPETVADCARAVRLAWEEGIPVHFLGGGTNLLVADAGVRGLVVRLAGRELSDIRFEEDRISAGAGASFPLLVELAVRNACDGFAALAGIPGTVGGALVMNAGGHYGQISAVVESVTILDPEANLVVLPREKIRFGYRSTDLADKRILSATFGRKPVDLAQARARLAEVKGYKHETQPLSMKSAGCIFKNPGAGKPPAGKLIDEAGLKGARMGGAMISSFHANFFVNDGNATATEMIALARLAREKVRERTGIDLQYEVELWGFEVSCHPER